LAAISSSFTALAISDRTSDESWPHRAAALDYEIHTNIVSPEIIMLESSMIIYSHP